MNISRKEEVTFVWTRGELLEALRRAFPNEFMLKKFKASDVSLRVTDTSQNFVLTGTLGTTPAEFTQRRITALADDDGVA